MVRTLMIQGTGSDVGKSLIAAGLCRILTRRGLNVRPFKPQNMSNNAAVTDDGGEIGRAQWLQALACGVAPSVHMNPVLLKPESDGKSQLIVQGKRIGTLSSREFQSRKSELQHAISDSFARIKSESDFVIIEGAGSPAETNLRARDVANMGFAEPLNIPVILVADIDRGGVVASLVGTHAVLNESDRACIKGFIINKFRGDVSLFAPALKEIETRTGWKALGVLPHLAEAGTLPKEDAFSLKPSAHDSSRAIRICVLRLPHIANLDDFDPLAAEDDVNLEFIEEGRAIPVCDAIIIPGTKSTIADLTTLRAQGWDIDIAAHVRRGGVVLGICGGYQMLGKTLHDPQGLDGTPGSTQGLGLLNVTTEFGERKQLQTWRGTCTRTGLDVTGYHMHMGQTQGADGANPMFDDEGATDVTGKIQGCYIHGMFVSDAWRHAFLNTLRPRENSAFNYTQSVENALDALADAMEQALAIEAMLELASEPKAQPAAA